MPKRWTVSPKVRGNFSSHKIASDAALVDANASCAVGLQLGWAILFAPHNLFAAGKTEAAIQDRSLSSLDVSAKGKHKAREGACQQAEKQRARHSPASTVTSWEFIKLHLL